MRGGGERWAGLTRLIASEFAWLDARAKKERKENHPHTHPNTHPTPHTHTPHLHTHAPTLLGSGPWALLSARRLGPGTGTRIPLWAVSMVAAAPWPAAPAPAPAAWASGCGGGVMTCRKVRMSGVPGAAVAGGWRCCGGWRCWGGSGVGKQKKRRNEMHGECACGVGAWVGERPPPNHRRWAAACVCAWLWCGCVCVCVRVRVEGGEGGRMRGWGLVLAVGVVAVVASPLQRGSVPARATTHSPHKPR